MQLTTSARDELDPQQLLAVLTAMRRGDFTVRMPEDRTGMAGKIADTLNDVLEMQQRTVTEFALFRVVGALPQKQGFVFEFDSLESSELNYKKDHRLACIGQEDVLVEGKTAGATKWKHSGNGIGDHYYWVKDGLVIKALIDGRKEWIFEPKK